MAGGVCRIVANFIPYMPESPPLEALYALTDLCLMFGLLAIYASVHERTGAAGLVGFSIAMAGLASIVGPDAAVFGVDFYLAGACVMLIGMLILSFSLLFARRLRIPAWLWIASFALSMTAAATGQALPAMLSGLAFGTGFVLAGFAINSFLAGPARVRR